MKTISNTIVAFHIGRGGRFNNGGHLSFKGEGEKTLQSFIDAKLFYDDYRQIWHTGDENDVGLTAEMVETGVGRIDIDGEYNTVYTKLVKDLDEGEL